MRDYKSTKGIFVRALPFVLTFPIVVACSSPSSGQDPATSAATLTYKLPETKVTVALSLQVADCAQDATQLIPTVDVQPSVVGGQSFTLKGSALASWTKSRDLTVTLYDNGTIKSVNAQAQDQLGSILTNIVKTAVSVAAIAGTNGPSSGVSCSATTVAALEKAKRLVKGISALKDGIATAQYAMADAAAANKDTSAMAKRIASMQSDATQLATQLVAIRSSADLTISLPAQDLPLSAPLGTISWETQRYINQWKALQSKENLGALFTLGYCLDTSNSAKCTISSINQVKNQKPAPVASPSCPGDTTCSATIVFRDPKNATLSIIAYGEGFPNQSAILKPASVIVPQLGEFSYIGFNVGFGENRTIGLNLDAYGNKTQLSWKSDAQANNVTGSVSNISSSASDLATKIGGAELAEKKAEVDQLNTEKSLNQLQACKAVLDAGGFACPSQ